MIEEGEAISETDAFQTINNHMKMLGSLIESGRMKDASISILEMNKMLKSICSLYNSRHDVDSVVFDVNLSNSVDIRNLLLINALYGVGPFIFSDETTIQWNVFASSLEISEIALKAGYHSIPDFFSQDAITELVKTSLSTGFIEDYEIIGIVYSIGYFIQFILLVERKNLPFKDCTSFFYSNISKYSYPLLITSIISIQQTNPLNRELQQEVSRLMSFLVMQPTGVLGIINTYLSFSEGADMEAIMKVAKGIAFCHSSVNQDDYWNSVFSQIISILSDKSSNQFVLITCCTILNLTVTKQPTFFFSLFFSKVFSCYLILVKQPYYRSLSLNKTVIPSFPIPAETISQANRILLRLCQFGNNLLPLLNSLTIILPSLFHLYVFSSKHSLGLTAVVSKILHVLIRNSRYTVRTFVNLLQERLPCVCLRFDLDPDCHVILRETTEDDEWCIGSDNRENWIHQVDLLVKLFVESGSTESCSDLLLELLDSAFSTIPLMKDDHEGKIELIAVLLRILESPDGRMFLQFDLLHALQVIERLFCSLESLKEVVSVEAIEEVFLLVKALLESILSQSPTIPSVIDIEREKEIRLRRKHANEIIAEEEEKYKMKLHSIINLLIQENNQTMGIWNREAQATLARLLMQLEKHVSDITAEVKEKDETPVLKEEIRGILKDIHSPFSPIRSMGLSRLETLIRTRTKDEVKPYVSQFLSVLQRSINDEDECVYLAGISAVMILGSRFYDEVIPFLLTLIGNASAPFDLRIRGIEAVVSVVHYMNESSTKFADSIVHSLLFYMDSKNELSWKTVELKKKTEMTAEDEITTLQLIRASCFSALAEIYSKVVYGVDHCLPEILSHCRGVMLFEQDDEKAVMVRRGVGLLVYRIIETHPDVDVELIVQKGLRDPDLVVSSHFRMCADKMKENCKLSKPLIEEL